MVLLGSASPGISSDVGHPEIVEKLRAQIVELIKKSNRGISFSEFMGLALYEPELGYYSIPRKIGKKGDFFTSVSVGPCFGMLLARQIRQIWLELGSPTDFCVVEQGAHDGQLAEDILNALSELGIQLDYAIVEPKPAYRQLQVEKLGSRLSQHPQRLSQLGANCCVFIGNELLDAFPVDRFRFEGGRWCESRVVLDTEGNLMESPFPLEGTLPLQLSTDVEEGFVTEFCPGIRSWTAELDQAFETGAALLFDYGLMAEEFFDPGRKNGTLRTYREHKSPESPFEAIGETDLTAQVNFSHVINSAQHQGFHSLGLIDQNRFLTGVAANWLREIDGQQPSALVRQFQTLTHPGTMGRAFQTLVLAKNVPKLPLDGLRFAR